MTLKNEQILDDASSGLASPMRELSQGHNKWLRICAFVVFGVAIISSGVLLFSAGEGLYRKGEVDVLFGGLLLSLLFCNLFLIRGCFAAWTYANALHVSVFELEAEGNAWVYASQRGMVLWRATCCASLLTILGIGLFFASYNTYDESWDEVHAPQAPLRIEVGPDGRENFVIPSDAMPVQQPADTSAFIE